MESKKKYYLDQDNEGHWMLVNSAYACDYQRWLEIDSDDPRAWETPPYAEKIGGNPNVIEFENPVNILDKPKTAPK